MKVRNFAIAIALLLGTLAFPSCSKDDDEPNTDGQEQTGTSTDNSGSSSNSNGSSSNTNSNSANNSSVSTDNDWVGDGTYVDLGLPSGLLWATYNVGAEKPEEVGGYFAWGEVKTNTRYQTSTYTVTRYNSTDGLKVLEAQDDAATVNLGEEWRTPTVEEWQELIDGCAWKWVDNYNGTGVSGKVVYKKKMVSTYDYAKDAHIFLPVGGYYNGTTHYDDSWGFYWSATLSGYSDASLCKFLSNDLTSSVYITTYSRYGGFLVRPVKNK